MAWVEIVRSLLYMWQLPQHLLALLLIKIVRASYTETYKGVKVYRTNFKMGISLGNYIIVNYDYRNRTIKHEHGHSLQSKKLGWLYFIVVGLPSITMNILTRIGILKHESYYRRFPENWADSLGGVDYTLIQ